MAAKNRFARFHLCGIFTFALARNLVFAKKIWLRCSQSCKEELSNIKIIYTPYEPQRYKTAFAAHCHTNPAANEEAFDRF
ncbi:hypothetical protein D3C86_1634740 [compost metagenome]